MKTIETSQERRYAIDLNFRSFQEKTWLQWPLYKKHHGNLSHFLYIYTTADTKSFTLKYNPMDYQVIDQAHATHYLWGAHCDSWILVNNTDLSVKQERMPRGAKEKQHFHSRAQQFFYILKGEATFYVGGEKRAVTAQQGLSIPARTPHFIANEAEAVLEFLVISQPTTDNDRTLISMDH